MAAKFGRTYQMFIQTADGGTLANGGALAVALPFTVEFDITRKTLSSCNVAQFRIYNLSATHRNAIRFNLSNINTYRQVIFAAGYQGNLLPICFQGNITQAWSYREGTNFITQIECFDGGFAFSNGFVSGTTGQFPPGTTTDVALLGLITGALPKILPGAITNSLPTPSMTTQTYTGSTVNVLNDLAKNMFFIDNEKAYILNTNDAVAGTPAVINAATGLLSTPLLEQTTVRLEMLFEPTLALGSTVNVSSLTEQAFNGIYKIIGIKHRGMISPAVCGSATTTGEFYFDKLLNFVPRYAT